MSVHALSQGFLGTIGRTEPVHLNSFLDRAFHVVQCRTSNLARLFPYVRDWSGRESWNFGLYGAASEPESALADLKAIAEAAERYSSAVLDDSEYIVASADELGETAFDWRTLPRLSSAELAAPGQLLHNFEPAEAIRWVQSVRLSDQAIRLIPTVVTHLYPRAWSSERFWNPISTGVAVHVDRTRAAVSGMLEVIERDALSLNWLTCRPLPRIHLDALALDELSPAVAEVLSAGDIALYQGTTDLGVPVVYARRHRPRHPRVVNVVGCAADFRYARAVDKAVSELVMIGAALEMSSHRPPEELSEFQSLLDGAVHMMHPARAPAFGFLDRGGDVDAMTLFELDAGAPDTPEAGFAYLHALLGAHGKEAYLAELTPDELRDCELVSVRAFIPGLMPMSFMHRSRFLGSRRLAEFARWLGLRGAQSDWLNPAPQPFA